MSTKPPGHQSTSENINWCTGDWCPGALNMFQKILLVRIGNIGDVLFATPVIRKLRKTFKEAAIDILTSPQGEPVLEANPYLNEIFIYHKFHKFFRWFKRKKLLNSLIRREYDLCVVLESNFEYTQFAHRASPKALRIGIDSPFSKKFLNKSVEFSNKRHAIENYLYVLSQLLDIEIEALDFNMDFFLKGPDEQLYQESKRHIEKGFFVIHSSCSNYLPYKGWPIDNFVSVADYLINHGLSVFITGSLKDKEPRFLLDKIKDKQGVYNFIGRNLHEVAFLIKHAKGVLCLDTGILHIARALNTPLVGLFGPSDTRHTGPVGPGVYQVIRKDFSCGPCHYSPEYRLKEKANCLDGNVTACMKAIEVEEVIGAIQSIIHGFRKS
jgi:lipopolysaccharide heptosyltransferase II